jgi:hypothetical protein
MLPDSALARLRALQSQRDLDEVERNRDALCITAFLSGWYLTTKGEVLEVSYIDGTGTSVDLAPHVVTTEQRYSVIAIARRRWGIPGLEELLPTRPSAVADCSLCGGSGFFDIALTMSSDAPDARPCPTCHGLGWETP